MIFIDIVIDGESIHLEYVGQRMSEWYWKDWWGFDRALALNEGEPETEGGEHDGGQPEAKDDLGFLPANLLEPEVIRGDRKKFFVTIAFGQELKSAGGDLKDKDATNDDQSNDLAQ